MSSTRKLYDQKFNYLRKEFIDLQNKVTGEQGFNGSYIDESKPSFNKADCEKIISGKTNAGIVFGRDRAGSLKSIGYTAAAAVDIVAGRASSHKKVGAKQHGVPDQDVSVDPSFSTDAARVYLTQRGNVDAAFALAQGSEPIGDAKNKSAAGMKADHLRFVARNHIKLVTGQGQFEGGEERNSQGGAIERCGRIDLIAGNYTEDENMTMFSFGGNGGISSSDSKIKKLQPIPKGDNLRDLLSRMIDLMSDLCQYTFDNSVDIAPLATIAATHVHTVAPGPAGPVPIAWPLGPGPSTHAGTMPSRIIKGLGDKLAFQFNLGIAELDYLTPALSAKYINSSHVNTT